MTRLRCVLVRAYVQRVYLPVCAACLPACLPACLSVCLPACLSVYLSVCPFNIFLSFCLCVGEPRGGGRRGGGGGGPRAYRCMSVNLRDLSVEMSISQFLFCSHLSFSLLAGGVCLVICLFNWDHASVSQCVYFCPTQLGW